MMSVEIKVNTVLIGHIYLRNIKHLDFDKYEYVYHYYKPEIKSASGHDVGVVYQPDNKFTCNAGQATHQESFDQGIVHQFDIVPDISKNHYQQQDKRDYSGYAQATE